MERPSLQSGRNRVQTILDRIAALIKKGSAYFPVDASIFPAVYRLYVLKYVKAPYLNIRQWTFASLANMCATLIIQLVQNIGQVTVGKHNPVSAHRFSLTHILGAAEIRFKILIRLMTGSSVVHGKIKCEIDFFKQFLAPSCIEVVPVIRTVFAFSLVEVLVLAFGLPWLLAGG